MDNCDEYYCLNITVNICCFSPMNNNGNTSLKYYRKQAFKKRLKLIGGPIKYFLEKVTGT